MSWNPLKWLRGDDEEDGGKDGNKKCTSLEEVRRAQRDIENRLKLVEARVGIAKASHREGRRI